MNFQQFLEKIVPKTGAPTAINIAQDARILALENIIINKQIASKMEIEAEVERCLEDAAKNILSI